MSGFYNPNAEYRQARSDIADLRFAVKFLGVVVCILVVAVAVLAWQIASLDAGPSSAALAALEETDR